MTLTLLSTDEVLARFQAEHFERNSISPGRRKSSLVVLTFLATLLDGRSLVEMTPSDFMRWQGAELSRVKPNTLRNRETMVRAFITWATQAQVISFEQSAQLKSVTPVRGARNPKPNPYKKADIARFREQLEAKYPLAPLSGPGSHMVRRFLSGQSPFIRAAHKHARRLQFEAQVALALEHGLRLIEIATLTIPQLHPDNTGVVVFTAKGEPGEVREREVTYTAHGRQCVQEWLDFRTVMAPGHDHPWLALKLREGDARDAQTPEQFSMALRVFGKPYWRWHRFRHTFATERLRAGMPLEKLQIMMGHANLAQTLAYAEIVNSDVRSEAERTEGDFARNLGLEAG